MWLYDKALAREIKLNNSGLRGMEVLFEYHSDSSSLRRMECSLIHAKSLQGSKGRPRKRWVKLYQTHNRSLLGKL